MAVACCSASVAILRQDMTSQGTLRLLTPTLSSSFIAVCATGMAWVTRIPQRTWLTSLKVRKQSRPSLHTRNLTMLAGPSSLPAAVHAHLVHLLLARSDSLPRASLPPLCVAMMWSPGNRRLITLLHYFVFICPQTHPTGVPQAQKSLTWCLSRFRPPTKPALKPKKTGLEL